MCLVLTWRSKKRRQGVHLPAHDPGARLHHVGVCQNRCCSLHCGKNCNEAHLVWGQSDKNNQLFCIYSAFLVWFSCFRALCCNVSHKHRNVLISADRRVLLFFAALTSFPQENLSCCTPVAISCIFFFFFGVWILNWQHLPSSYGSEDSWLFPAQEYRQTSTILHI